VQNTHFTLSERTEKLLIFAFGTALIPMKDTGLLNQSEVWYMVAIYKTKREDSGRTGRTKQEMKHGAVTK
jgi:hypothetical protein